MEIRDAIELIQDTAQKAAEKQIVKVQASVNPHTTQLVMPDGTVQTIREDFPYRKHTVYDIDSLAKWADDGGKAHIWHCDRQVVLVIDDDAYRDNTVTLPLPLHPKFVALEKETNSKFSQKPLIDFLRLNLKEEIEQSQPGFIALLRNIKFRSGDEGHSTVEVGKESMGRTVEATVTGATAFPEEIFIQLPMWLHLDMVVTVPIAFDVDLTTRDFTFKPKPGAVEQAKVTAQKWLHDQLAAACDGSPIFYGTP